MKDKYPTSVEIESLLGFWLISTFMIIRGVMVITTNEQSIERSDLYSTMNDITPFFIWGIIFIIGAIIILISTVSQTRLKYIGLIVGNFLGVLVGFPFAIIAFLESHMVITQFTITLVAFFNFVLLIHSGVAIWREKRKIHMLQKQI